ncbi:putative membrane protein YeaQ/YmgE (transglycosylase-associated protein family) [Bifidobacterium commune]|uniref:DUF3180 domain-containing protein n=1 Tax=Bifidobacterium commune TaxID=1505727 RepID=A0A1C4H340_9BIFI|nr:DUF3180 domain-containing protein [Bifidobacterium commune]MBB2955083.1 putative membrane protein YeaQ/YmgE (transglycosylase-associated protein family) [Bifidobacterium commune]SCC79414.1 Protein of unknown function [Bifidobacterium commune]
MSARRTAWWYYVIAALLGLLLGAMLFKTDEITRLSLIGAPWFVSFVLVLLGVVVLVLALQVHQYAITDPTKRKSWVDPTKAVYTLMLSKALGVAGAMLAGWYLAQLLLCLPHWGARYYQSVVIQCGIATVICIADMIVGIIGEWLCQLPPSEGPDDPKIKTAKRRERRRKAIAGSVNKRRC